MPHQGREQVAQIRPVSEHIESEEAIDSLLVGDLDVQAARDLEQERMLDHFEQFQAEEIWAAEAG